MHSSHISSTHHTDVLVIGTNILSTFHDYYAAKKGYKTILLERNQFPSDASMRDFGMIVQTIVETGGEWSLFAHASREIYQAIQAETDITVKNPGSLYLASREAEQQVLKEFAATYAPTYFCQHLDANEALKRYPAFQSCPSYPLLQEQPVDEYIRAYSIHLLFKQAADSTVIIGDSHEYSTFEEANGGEEYTSCHSNEVILRYGQRMITLPSWELQTIMKRTSSRVKLASGLSGPGVSR